MDTSVLFNMLDYFTWKIYDENYLYGDSRIYFLKYIFDINKFLKIS